MQTDHKILDDLARVAASALGTLQGVRDEVEARLRDQFERILSNMELVTREEFDAVKARLFNIFLAPIIFTPLITLILSASEKAESR